MTRAPNKRPAYEPASELLKPVSHDPGMKRPATTVAGVLLVLLRVVSGLIVLLTMALNGPSALTGVDLVIEGAETTFEMTRAALISVVVLLAAVLLVDGVLALFIFTGHNWARVTVMAFAALSITGAFVQWWSEGQEITLNGSLLTLGLDILILLALSSRSAAAYARRHERR